MSDEFSVAPAAERLAPPTLPGPGDQLRAARLQQGLEIADVARQLKLFPRQVEAMERDDFAALPGRVFVRGFIRNYARVLGIDARPLLEMAGVALEASTDGLPAIIAPAKAQAVAAVIAPHGGDIVVPMPLSASDNVRSHRWVIGAVVMTVAVLVGYMLWYQSDSTPNGSVVAVTLPPAAGSASEAAPAPSAQGTADAAAGVSGGQTVERAVGAAPADVVAPPQGAAVVAAADPADAGAGPAIRLSFTRAAWVEIRDRSGAVVFSQLSPAGAQRVVRGTPPFSLVVGNASGVAVVFDGRDIDLAPYTRTDIAHLTLE